MGNHHMETSHNKDLKCGHFHMYLFLFQIIDNMGDILQIHESFTYDLASMELNGVQPPFTQVHLHRKTWKYGSGN